MQKNKTCATAYKYHCYFHTLAFFLLRQRVTRVAIECFSLKYLVYHYNLALIKLETATMDLLKEMKDQMAALTGEI